jgi:hypothetical protein
MLDHVKSSDGGYASELKPTIERAPLLADQSKKRCPFFMAARFKPNEHTMKPRLAN